MQKASFMAFEAAAGGGFSSGFGFKFLAGLIL
jgi:hypothetical protein